ncbi:pentapeptide repeat-containing protein, partial [Campylobacter coli]
AHFEDNAYFNNSEFYSYADFHECEFDDIACFYGVKFYKAPNFSACYFKEPKAVNLINVDIDKLDFKSVEKYIEDNYQDETCENKQEITEEQRNNNCKLKCAKHLKDSFRVIKDVLITQNNTLEAQEWHKLELYVKEKENHINLNVKEREKNTDIFKNILIWFNCVLLNVYRNTSDHHNDFLKILNFTIGMIALYGVFFYLLLEV